jgi:DNA recombination protein RmuC
VALGWIATDPDFLARRSHRPATDRYKGTVPPVDPVLLAAVASVVVSFTAAVLAAVILARLSRHDPARLERALREELRLGRDEAAKAARRLRGESARASAASREEAAHAAAVAREETTKAVAGVREGVEQRLRDLQSSNEKRLDEMRRTVDEKLHEALEKRLGESFRTVSSQLEAVHKGLGEMQSLASGVGDLKKVLTNVKTRGTWGEVQLGALLEQMLVPEQFERNVCTKKGSRDNVEFAVRLPGALDGSLVYLPIDSKFPQEDYVRLVEASEIADGDAVQRAAADLARAIRKCAQDIRDKYVDPPGTTDFAILFVPTEGLFAEVLRYPGLTEELQHTYRVVVCGPTTLAATLSSLRMGFRTLAIEKRASEVWQVLAAVKTEFGKFAGTLDKVRSQLETAQKTIESTGRRTRAMARRLKDVETLPGDEARDVLQIEADEEEPSEPVSGADRDEGPGG